MRFEGDAGERESESVKRSWPKCQPLCSLARPHVNLLFCLSSFLFLLLPPLSISGTLPSSLPSFPFSFLFSSPAPLHLCYSHFVRFLVSCLLRIYWSREFVCLGLFLCPTSLVSFSPKRLPKPSGCLYSSYGVRQGSSRLNLFCKASSICKL